MTYKRSIRLPNKLIVLKNKDKAFHETWTTSSGRQCNALNVPHPFRALCLGKPNVGKGVVIKNLILRQKPYFEEIYCIHPDGRYTEEWKDVDAIMLSDIPPPDQFEGKVKTLVILDDLELQNLGREQSAYLDRLYGYCSTHKNISVICANQDFFSIPSIIRRCSNLFVLWKSHDLDSMNFIAKKVGLTKEEFRYLFRHFINKKRDSLWIDLTDNTPYPLRKNGFTLIERTENNNFE